jgi:hypothetical protein
MPESTTHIVLVEHLLEWTRHNHSNSADAIVFVDLPSMIGTDKPPTIGGYNPDLYCKQERGQYVVIGEAKSAGDIETRHSREQLKAYLTHLKQYSNGVLVIAVPWHTVGQARSLIRMLQRLTDTLHVRTEFIEKLPG